MTNPREVIGGIGPMDTNLVLRASGDGSVSIGGAGGTTTESNTGTVTIKETPAGGLAAVLVVPSDPGGTTPSLDVELRDPDDSDALLAKFPTLGASPKGVYVTQLATEANKVEYWMKANLAGGTGGWGNVVLFLTDSAW